MEKTKDQIFGKCIDCHREKGKTCYFPSIGFRMKTEAGVELTCADLLALYDQFRLIGLLKKNGGFKNVLDQ